MSASEKSTQSKSFKPPAGFFGLVLLLTFVCIVRAVSNPNQSSFPVDEIRFSVDLNSASKAELMALPNLGPLTANKIVEHRQRIGRFTDVNQLLQVPGIGAETMRYLRPMLTISSENTDGSLAKK